MAITYRMLTSLTPPEDCENHGSENPARSKDIPQLPNLVLREICSNLKTGEQLNLQIAFNQRLTNHKKSYFKRYFCFICQSKNIDTYLEKEWRVRNFNLGKFNLNFDCKMMDMILTCSFEVLSSAFQTFYLSDLKHHIHDEHMNSPDYNITTHPSCPSSIHPPMLINANNRPIHNQIAGMIELFDDMNNFNMPWPPLPSLWCFGGFGDARSASDIFMGWYVFNTRLINRLPKHHFLLQHYERQFFTKFIHLLEWKIMSPEDYSKNSRSWLSIKKNHVRSIYLNHDVKFSMLPLMSDASECF